MRGEDAFLAELRADLKARTFEPLPVRERMIPNAGGKLRRLRMPTVRDRVVQAALKLVLEPIFEADFKPVSYGFRPKRRAYQTVPGEMGHRRLRRECVALGLADPRAERAIALYVIRLLGSLLILLAIADKNRSH
ncbi:MAG TPA: hypothetical protein VK988_20750 [Acidimicrobiales bacterium]|nr:hypothetical protein [Acidimicrobiales bacterium]